MDKPQLNLLERAVAEVFPKWGFRRLRDKTALALAGGYTGASRSRAALRNWNPHAADAVADTAYDLQTLRARSRDLVRNAPLAGGAINTITTNVVGTGLSMQSRIDRKTLGLDDAAAEAWQENAEREFRLWCESADCDATRTQNFYGIQSLVFRSALESGDVLTVTPSIERKSNPYTLALQVVEADRVCNKGFTPNTASLVDGVVLDGYGAPVAYQVCSIHPGSLHHRSGAKWTEVAAFGAATGRRNVLHLFDPVSYTHLTLPTNREV